MTQNASQPNVLMDALAEICARDAPLNERLAAYGAKLREYNQPFAEAYDDLVQRIAAGSIGTEAPQVGEPMPEFLLPETNGHLVSLDDLTRNGPAVISFNRGHWCPFCKIELTTIARYSEALAAHGAEIASIMPDRQEFAERTRSETRRALHVLTDVENGYALSLGLAIWLGEDVERHLRARGHQLEVYQGCTGWFVPVPATFVVAHDKTVLARSIDPDFRRRMEIDDILAALTRARQTTGPLPPGTRN